MIIRSNHLNLPARLGGTLLILIAFLSLTVSDVLAQRGRGGGRRGGGGGYRPPTQSIHNSPSMSRQSSPRQSASRPTRSTNRPATGTRPATGNRGGASSRQGAIGSAGRGANPSRNDLSSFLNGSGGRTAGGALSRSAGGNAAINDFFSHSASSANHNAATTHDAGSIAGQRAQNISGRTEARSEFRGSRGENRDFASENRQERVSGRGDRQAARVTTRGETRSSLAAGRGENRSQRQQQRSEHADHIRQELENEFDENHLFDDFWKDNPEAYYRFNQNPVFWTWATVGTVGRFFGAAYGTAGGGGEVYYEDGTVYSEGEEIPAEEYSAQAEEIVENTPKVEDPDDMEWLPLGVFALSENAKSEAAPNLFLQLAVSKEGIIAGTLNNKSTDEVKSVEGMLDAKSRRAAWTIAGKSSPIMETSMDSLTENETNALVHFADGSTQEWLMLHLEKPAEEK